MGRAASDARWRSADSNSNSEAAASHGIRYWEPRCDYPRAQCGLENQGAMGLEFEAAHTYVGSAYVKVMVVDSSKGSSSAARLITPYIKARNREETCLHLQYLVQGSGVEAVTVIQQDRLETRPVYTVSGADKRGMWRLAKMDLVMREGISRYFVEVRVRSGATGMFMLREFFYEAGRCRHEDPGQFRRSRLMNKYWQLSGH